MWLKSKAIVFRPNQQVFCAGSRGGYLKSSWNQNERKITGHASGNKDGC
jgi:hypothetical protein